MHGKGNFIFVYKYNTSVYIILPVKQPLALRAFAFKTGSMAFSEHGENLLLFRLSPDVARANII